MPDTTLWVDGIKRVFTVEAGNRMSTRVGSWQACRGRGFQRRWFAGLCMALAGWLLPGMPSAQAQTPTLRVGLYENPPKVFTDAKGQASGSLVELLQAMAQAEGWRLTFVPCDWQACLTALERGELDVMPDVAVTEERRQRFDFHRTPALHSWSQLYRRSPQRIESVQDLQGKRVAVLEGGIQATALRNLLAGFNVQADMVPVSSVADGFARLSIGEVDAAAASYHFGDYRAADFGLVATPVVFQPAQLFYAVPKGRHPEVLTAIDQRLDAWLADDDSPYFQVMRHWQTVAVSPTVPRWAQQTLAALAVLGAGLALAAFWQRRAVRRATAALRQVNARMTATLQTLPDLLFEIDDAGRYLAVHTAHDGLLVAPATELIGRRVADFMPGPAAQGVMQALDTARQHGLSTGQVIAVETPQGPRWFELSVARKPDATPRHGSFIVLSRDITRRHEAEQHAQQQARLYAALSAVNEAARTCQTEADMLQRVCQAVVVHGDCTLAWAGWVEPGASELRPAVHHGSGQAFLDQLVLPLHPDHPDRQGPAAWTVAHDQPYWCDDYMGDPRLQAWRAQAEVHGWRSMAVLPLHAVGRVAGVLVLYARVRGVFDAQSQQLLLRLTQTLDDGLARLRQDAERARLQRELAQSEMLYRNLTESLTDVIWTLDLETRRFTYMSPSVLQLRGYTADEVMAQPLESVVMPESIPLVHRLLQAAWQEAQTAGSSEAARQTLEVQQPCKDGRLIWTEVVTNLGHNPVTGRPEIRGVTRDISERKRAEERIRNLVEFDQLSGLLNRAALQTRLVEVLQRARESGGPVALLLLDLDHFKHVNDSLGHLAGDLVLVEVARRLQTVTQRTDLLCRMSADEFIAVLPDSGLEATTQVVQALLQAMRQPFGVAQHEVRTACSIGVAMFPVDASDADELLRKADAAMYRAKAEGRGDFRFFTADMQAESERLLALSSALAEALERQQLEVHYQAQVDLATGQLVGAEALLRWTHPQWGAISPAEFIPVAESTGLILPIGQWVLERAVRDAKVWQDAGCPVRVAVNLSAVQFRHPRLLADLGHLLDRSGLPPHLLELELTESLTMGDPDRAVDTLQALHGLGLRLSIDDFGTGYSSLGYLKQLPVDTIKIDQGFVRDIGVDAEDEHIIRAIIQLAKALNLGTLAEGVETAQQARFLHNQGCDHMQGWRVHRACNRDAFTEFVRTYRAVPPSA